MDSLPYSILTESNLQNIKLKLAYDGTSFFGWQDTKEGPSIEGTLKRAVEEILQEKILLQAASRTDRGVHAEEQVVNFVTRQKIDLHDVHKSLNALLPSTIRVIAIENMELSFHPTLDAKSKEYHYQIYRGNILPPKERHYCWHIYEGLSLDLMKEAIPYFLGKKDFSSFTNKSNLDRTIFEICLFEILLNEESDQKLKIIVRGERFLYKMVRNIVGTLIFVGKGKISPLALPSIFAKKDRSVSGMTAPAKGLTLMKVFYDR